MPRETIYVIQSSFTTGEISPEVANRVDLDKYQSALLNAENAYIRPYGAVYKRTGSLFCGYAKSASVKLIEFKSKANAGFLLEVGDKYIRIWKDGVFTGQEVTTPYAASELSKLRTAQSADIMYIASGTHPVMQLKHYADNDWRFEEMEISRPYFDATAQVENYVADETWDKAGTYSWPCGESGDYLITVAGAGGGGCEDLSHKRRTGYGESDNYVTAQGGKGGNGELLTKTVYLEANTVYSITVGNGGTKANPGNDGESSSFGNIISAKGGGGGQPGTFTSQRKVTGRPHKYYRIWSGHEGAAGISYGNGGQGTYGTGNPGLVKLKSLADIELTASGISGRMTITAGKSFFTKDMEGMWMKLSQDIPSQAVQSNGNQTTDAIAVGSSWKIITHGTWTGTITIQRSVDGGEWKNYRTYRSNDDNNISESGTENIEDNVRLRIVATAGRADLTANAYTKDGMVVIESVNSATQATCLVKQNLGKAGKIDAYCYGAWNNKFGYPRTVAFFQDRLVFGGTSYQPYVVWMSKTGDYNNFSVEKASGTITDDSAIALSFISREQAEIKHLCPANDLYVLTDANEWIISGGDTVTPTKCTPKAQTFRGCSDVEPMSIGGRLIYIQRRAQTVRDMAYSFETDSYDGMDITLLAKNLLRGMRITDIAYMQDPDSRLYFVRSDGALLCLSYIKEQKVYAWSHIKTDGAYLSVCSVAGDTEDDVYTAVQRQGKTYIEKLTMNAETSNPKDYIMLDCAKVFTFTSPEDSQEVKWLFGKVTVLADGKCFSDVEIDENGIITLPTKVSYMIIGLPYTMKLELPNLEINTQNGTLQGRNKNVRSASLRLLNSLGGKIGNGVGPMDAIKYEELSDQEITLYTGDKEITIPNRGVEKNGRVLIQSDEPYPFNLAALVREVVIND